METKHTLFKDLRPDEQTIRLTQMVQQAYFRRSRQLPANLSAIVDLLKSDIVKHLPDITVEELDLGITTSTLNDTEANLSEAFFFAAAKKQCPQRTNTHQWDGYDEDLAYWRERRDWFERHFMAGTPQHQEACEMIRHYEQGDTEQDTIGLLDTCASMLSKMDDYERQGIAVAKVAVKGDIRIPLPAFNSRREYHYLVRRGQIALNAYDAFISEAIQEVNQERLRSHHPRLERDKAETDPDVIAQAKRLAVLGWLRQCNEQGTTPSAILTPLADELQYRQIRKETV